MSCASCACLESIELNVCQGCGPAYTKWTPYPVSNKDESPVSQLTQIGGTHYLRSIQPFDIIGAWELGFFRGNIIKYVLSCTAKNEKEDLMKARHYLDHCIENYDELRATAAF